MRHGSLITLLLTVLFLEVLGITVSVILKSIGWI